MSLQDSESCGFIQSNPSASFGLSSEPNTNIGKLPQSEEKWMAVLWARKYISFVNNRKTSMQSQQALNADAPASKPGRCRTAKLLNKHLSFASAKAWSETEKLLASEIHAHNISLNLIDPIAIATDLVQIFKKTFHAYAHTINPERLSVLVGSELGAIRQKYTEHDPRVLGCVSMQFHYTGKNLLNQLSEPERHVFSPYVKVMDDHMYMPLQKLYTAAADHPFDSSALRAVKKLLATSTQIASSVREKVCLVNPNYQSYSGLLQSDTVRESSIRDVEMFQIYLCLCVLENSISSVQKELFPLCVMLYPPLKVEWMLVQDMLQALTWEMANHLSKEDMSILLPYLRLLSDMFSMEVFRDFQ